MEITKRNICIFVMSVFCIAGVTFLARYVRYIDICQLRTVALFGMNLLNGILALAAMRLMGMKISADFRNGRQYLLGAAMAVVLSLLIAVLPAVCGFSLVGSHVDFSWFTLCYDLLFYLLIIGPVEEFVFRVYL